jgi:hypothetical protein
MIFLHGMNYLKTIIFIIFTCLLVACDKHEYVTWKCVSNQNTSDKFTFILDGPALNLLEKHYSFCGSFGPNSYFDERCPAQATEAKLNLNPKSGIFKINEQQYQCKSL